jgi:hypothetical protein
MNVRRGARQCFYRGLLAIAVLAAGVCAGCGDGSGTGASVDRPFEGERAGAHFALQLQQGDSIWELSDGSAAAIDAEPFSLIVALRELGGVLVHASRDRRLFEVARRGGSLERALPFDALEDAPAGALRLDEDAWTSWYAVSPRTTSFDDVRMVRDGDVLLAVFGRRDVRQVETERGSERLDALAGETIYLVFVHTRWGPGRTRIERQRLAVALELR